jgi:diadenosine tetraphosphate (Ap4A) HIT family hydrolase
MGDARATPEPCVFCDIATHRAPSHVVYEDDATLAFLDLFPFTRGHLLVIPKRHGARLPDLSSEDQFALIRTIAKLCHRMERLTSDYHLSLNAGAKAGQVVFHVHFHIIPRYSSANPFEPKTRVRLDDGDARALVGLLSAG